MKTPDVEFYRKLKADFIVNMKRRELKWDTFSSDLSLFCACTGLPVYVAIVFAQEEFPEFVEQLEKSKKSVVEFYGYDT